MEDARDIYEHLADMRASIQRAAWSELEDAYRRSCEQLAGVHQAVRIASLNFDSYERSLVAALRSTLEHAAAARARALYFEESDGLEIRFEPDPTVFGKASFQLHLLAQVAREIALVRRTSVEVQDSNSGSSYRAEVNAG